MSKKIFTLIYGDQIDVAPHAKIIPAETFSSLQHLSEVMERVKDDAQKYRLKIVQDAELIKEEGFKKGFEEGYQKWAEQLAYFEAQLQDIQQNVQKSILPVALSAAKKIVGREIKLAPETIVDIVQENLKNVNQHKKIIIYVNKNDLTYLENQKSRIRDLFEHLESLSIRARDDIEEGGCVIETEVGIINAQLPHRWQVLEKAFEQLMKVTPEPSKES